MKKLCIRVTDLDAYRYYLNSEMTEKEFIDRLKRKSKPNEAMLKGTAWHKVLEDVQEDLDGVVEQNGFKFNISFDGSIEIPQIKEIRAGANFVINGVSVYLAGGCDGITGLKITDHKLTFNPKIDRYAESMQWRSYLFIYNASIFEYIIYSAKETDNFIEIYDISKLNFFSYPSIGDDVFEATKELVYFIQENASELIV